MLSEVLLSYRALCTMIESSCGKWPVLAGYPRSFTGPKAVSMTIKLRELGFETRISGLLMDLGFRLPRSTSSLSRVRRNIND